MSEERVVPVIDHEQRLYGWLLQVVRDKRNDVMWVRNHITGSGAESDVARMKCDQIIRYCEAVIKEADRQMAAWRADFDRRREEALEAGGAGPGTRAREMFLRGKSRREAESAVKTLERIAADLAGPLGVSPFVGGGRAPPPRPQGQGREDADPAREARDRRLST